MKRKIFLYVLLALTVLFALCFSSCEGGGIYIDTGSGTEDDAPDIDTSTNTNKDESTDTGTGDKTDTNTDFDTSVGDKTDTDTDTNQGGGNEDTNQGGDNQGGTGNENPDQGGDNQGGNGNKNPDQGGDNQGGTGNENPDQGGDNQGGNGNENPDQGVDNQGGNGNENPDQGGDNQGGNGNENPDQGDNNEEEPPAPITYTDKDGFVYVEENGELYCVDFVRPVDGTKIVYMPSEYDGKSVVGIKTNAFTDFGVAFGNSQYKNESYYYTIAIPESIKVVEAAAFDLCWGIRVCLYTVVQNGDKINYRLLDSSMKNDLPIILKWESNLILFDKSEKTNKQARDSIWGFRPAIGWSRYSAVQIPDYYE